MTEQRKSPRCGPQAAGQPRSSAVPDAGSTVSGAPLPRRRFLRNTGALAIAPSLAPIAVAQSTAKVLRYAFPAAETGFDPVQVSDLYSRIVTAHIFESLLIYDYLARPARVKPLVAEALPQVSPDFRTYTFRVRRGIFFQDDPAFKGRRRELTAQDFVYSFKRFWDPRWKSPVLTTLQEYKILGMNELRERVLKNKTPFPYDVEVEGLRALDRYTLQFRLADPAPHFAELHATPDLYGAVAREVIEAYGDDTMAHPIGTGPFRLADWRRSSRIVLERNPGYREHPFDAEPSAGDTRAQQVAERLRGRRLPLLDRVEVYIVDEAQPRWLAFLNGEHDLLERLPNEYVNIAAPGGKLAPSLARRHVQMGRVLGSDTTFTIFNMKDPVVGGYTPAKIALRRAIGLALDIEEEIRLVRRGQAIIAQAPINPHTYGYDPQLRTEMGEHSLARARALLDTYGYVDRDGDGWREQPDGAPLVIEHRTLTDQTYRQLEEVRKRHMDALGVRLALKYGQWPEHLKAARSGAFTTWSVGSSSASSDSRLGLQRAYGPAAGGQNFAHFDLPAFNRVYEQLVVTPDGPQRLALIREAVRLWIAYMPYKAHVHRVLTDLWHPWIGGYVRHPFMQRFWDHIEFDPGEFARSA
jgi:ABC-type transport system substrate-binding protein